MPTETLSLPGLQPENTAKNIYTFSYRIQSDADAKDLTQTLTTLASKPIQLSKITLSGEQQLLSADTLLTLTQALASLLLKQQPYLVELSVNYFQWLNAKPATLSWLTTLPGCKQLTSLKLNDNQLNAMAVPELSQALKGCKTLTYLNLGGNQFSELAIEYLLAGIGQQHALETLSLSANPLGAVGWDTFVQWLTPTKQHQPPAALSQIFLSACGISEISGFLNACQQAKLRLTQLSLDQNRLNDAQLVPLLNWAATQTKLSKLNLRQNPFTFASIAALPQQQAMLITQLQQQKQPVPPALLNFKTTIKTLCRECGEKAAQDHHFLAMTEAYDTLLSLDKYDEDAQEQLIIAQTALIEQAEQHRQTWQAHFITVSKTSLSTFQKRRYSGESLALIQLKAFFQANYRVFIAVNDLFRKIFSFQPRLSLQLYALFEPLHALRWPFSLNSELTAQNFDTVVAQLEQDLLSPEFLLYYARLIIYREQYLNPSFLSRIEALKAVIATNPSLGEERASFDLFCQALRQFVPWLSDPAQAVAQNKALLHQLRDAFMEDPIGQPAALATTQERLNTLRGLLAHYERLVITQWLTHHRTPLAALRQFAKKAALKPLAKTPATPITPVATDPAINSACINVQAKVSLPVAPMLEVNNDYQYEAEDIDVLLNLFIKKHQLDKTVTALGALDDQHTQAQLVDKLKKLPSQHPNTLGLLPFNLGGYHWIGAVLQFKNKELVSVLAFDPLGVAVSATSPLVKALQHAFPGLPVQSVPFLKQPDATSCGVVVVDGLLQLQAWLQPNAQPLSKDYTTLSTATIQKMRLNHLVCLESANPGYFQLFYPRQQANLPLVSPQEQLLRLKEIQERPLSKTQEQGIQTMANLILALEDTAFATDVRQVLYFNEKLELTAEPENTYLTQIRTLFKNTARLATLSKTDQERLKSLKAWLFKKDATEDFKPELEELKQLGRILRLSLTGHQGLTRSQGIVLYAQERLVNYAKTKEALQGVTSLKLVAKGRTFHLLDELTDEEIQFYRTQERVRSTTLAQGYLGEGHFGRVLLASCHLHEEKQVVPVAAKVIRKVDKLQQSSHEDHIQQALATIPWVNAFYGSGPCQGAFYQFTALCSLGSGQEVATLLHQLLNAKRLNTEEVTEFWIYLLHELLQGIAAIHAKDIYHLDITPDNFMLNKQGEVKLIDFGCAYQKAPKASTVSTVYYTANRYYLSPERLFNLVNSHPQTPHPYDLAKADIYAIGICLVELITKQDLHYEFYDIAKKLSTWNGKPFDAHLQTLDFSKAPASPLLVEVLRQMVCADDKARPDCQTLLQHLIFKQSRFIKNPALCDQWVATLLKHEQSLLTPPVVKTTGISAVANQTFFGGSSVPVSTPVPITDNNNNAADSPYSPSPANLGTPSAVAPSLTTVATVQPEPEEGPQVSIQVKYI